MVLVVVRGGQMQCLYDETLDLSILGSVSIRRASRVEPDEHGQWWADLAPVQGPMLGPFLRRSDALKAEQVWLEEHRLGAS
jgi:hypothetical protein